MIERREIRNFADLNALLRADRHDLRNVLLRPHGRSEGRVFRSSWMRPRPRTYWVGAGRRFPARAQAAQAVWEEGRDAEEN